MDVTVKNNGQKKKWFHDLTHDVSTTTDFGFCQPIMSREVSAEDTVNLCIPQFVRLGVVKKPTFGRMHLRTYNKFIPIETVYHPYGSLIAGQSYSHGGSSYIPTEVTNIKLCDLWKLCCLHSEIAAFTCDYEVSQDGEGIVSNLDPVSVYGFHDLLVDFFPQYSQLQYLEDLLLDDLGMTSNFIVPSGGQLQMSYYDWWYLVVEQSPQGDTYHLYCGRFTRAGKNLRSILIGCGSQLNLYDTEPVSVLPLLAYYKSYFDLFNPNREVTWKDSIAYQLIEKMEYYNLFNLFDAMNNGGTAAAGVSSLWYRFLLEKLPTCYYTCNPDYVSAHITGTALNVATQAVDDISDNEGNYGFPVQASNGYMTSVGGFIGRTPDLENITAGLGTGATNRSTLEVLDRLTKRINIHTALGARVKEYIQLVTGGHYFEEDVVDNLGSQSFKIDISDVFSLAETSEAALGEYAGKGVGAISVDGAEKISFKAPSVGFVVSIICLVPEARYCQSVDPMLYHITRRQFFDSDFDGITLLPSPKLSVYGVRETNIAATSLKGSFGNIPIYSEYKIANNILNGDMSRASVRNTFLPYTLDKLFPYTIIIPNGDDFSFAIPHQSLFVAGEFWRYVNRDRWFGNFDRIFTEAGTEVLQNEGESYNFFTDKGAPEDNFIIHNRIMLKLNSYALPLSHSFDTGAFDGATANVEKA